MNNYSLSDFKVNLNEITGTGLSGRILKDDVIRYIERQTSKSLYYHVFLWILFSNKFTTVYQNTTILKPYCYSQFWGN